MHSLNYTQNHILIKNLFVFLFFLGCKGLFGQFELIGDAVQIDDNTFMLTEDILNENGSVWHRLRHDFTTDFEVEGTFYFGEDEDGADGIVFVVQDVCIGAGGLGLGIGYGGFPGNSLGIEFDTYENAGGDVNDPSFDHIAVSQDGNVNHLFNLLGPIQMHPSNANVEDGNWYNYTIKYTASTNLIEVFFDGSLRLNYFIDIVNTVLDGNPYAYWGFTSATGGFSAPNSLSIDNYKAFIIEDTVLCASSSGITIDMQFSGASYTWSPDDGSIDDINGQVVTLTPQETTTYTVSQSDDCLGSIESSFTIFIESPIDINTMLEVAGCLPEGPNGSILIAAENGSSPYLYSIDGGNSFVPDNLFTGLEAGTYAIVVTDALGCDATTSVEIVTTQTAVIMSAGTDQVIQQGESVLSDAFLQVDGNLSIVWTPSEGLSCDTCINPLMSPTMSTTYTLSGIDDYGCTFSDEVYIEVILPQNQEENTVFIPNIFTPFSNDDNSTFTIFGNENLEVITKLQIYDRWGNLIFEQNDFEPNSIDGWNGTYDGQPVQHGVYVYWLEAAFVDGTKSLYSGDVMVIN